MTDLPIPYLRYDTPVVKQDGTLEVWFVNAINILIDRTGGQAYNALNGVINGATQQAQTIAAERAARIAGDAANAGANDGSGVSNQTFYSAGVSSGTSWVVIATVVVTPSGAGGDYTVTVTPDFEISGALSDGASGGTSVAVFNGNWRIREELTGGGTEYTLASGTFTVGFTPASEIPFGEGGSGSITIPESWSVTFNSLPTGLLAANEAAQVDIRLEIQRASGTNEITSPGLSGTMAVVWTA